MTVTAERLLAQCWACIDDDPKRSAAAAESLRDSVRTDPQGHVDAILAGSRSALERGEYLDEYSLAVRAIRDIDTTSLHRLFDLLLQEPSLWAPIKDSYDDWSGVSELVDHLGEGALSQAWHHYQRTEDPASWWAIDLVMDLNRWADKSRVRRLLLRLVADADDNTIVDVGCVPLEDFVSDDPEDLAWLEAQCAVNESMRTALGCVWCSRRVTDATLRRLDAAAGTTLARHSAMGTEFDASRRASEQPPDGADES